MTLIRQIARTSRLDEDKLRRLAKEASLHYKIYEIPKRGPGTRKIAHPSRELKALQRWITKVLIDRFPVHHTATAYRKGSSIRENAERHRATRYTNRYDFAKFFPSFKQHQIKEFIHIEVEKIGIQLSEEDIIFVGNVLCRYGKLTIGAPSSPAITNAMMFDFDQKIFDYCQSKHLVYTRYADDLFISSYYSGQLKNLDLQIARAKRQVPHLALRLNKNKTAYLSKKYVRRITGIIITPEHNLSIGRERKREIRALIHRWLNQKMELDEVHYMRGMLAFARDVEPTFEKSLRNKYGNGPIEEILRHPSLDSSSDPEFIANIEKYS